MERTFYFVLFTALAFSVKIFPANYDDKLVHEIYDKKINIQHSRIDLRDYLSC